MIIIPSSSSELNIYVDETYFDENSGVIQTALLVPDKGESVVIREVIDLLKEYGFAGISELKGSRIKKGNIRVYRKFLQYTSNVCSIIGSQSELRSIVTIEGKGRYGNKEIDWIWKPLKDVFNSMLISPKEELIKEVAKQIWWIYRYFDKICASPIKNEFAFIYDNKHRYAQECLNHIAVVPPEGSPMLLEHWKFITKAVDIFLRNQKRIKWFPKIKKFTFEFSERSCFLWGCDLFSNLFFNALKKVKGIDTRTTSLKYDLLRSVIPSLRFEKSLLNALETVDGKLICKDEQHGSRFQLDPDM